MKGVILAVDTAGDGVSLALGDGTKVWASRRKVKAADEALWPALEALLKKAKKRLTDLEGVACVTGPGRFTAVRIGVTFADTLARARGIPGIRAAHRGAARIIRPTCQPPRGVARPPESRSASQGGTGSPRPPDPTRHEARMAVRLQMKLGFVAEQDRLPDSPDTVFSDLTDWSIVQPNGWPDHRYNDRAVIRAFADHCALTFEFLLANGVVFKDVPPDNHGASTTGNSAPRENHAVWNKGAGLESPNAANGTSGGQCYLCRNRPAHPAIAGAAGRLVPALRRRFSPSPVALPLHDKQESSSRARLCGQ